VADSLSFRVADLNERGPRYKWRHLIELLRRTQGSSASPGAPTKSTQASAPSSISPPHSSIRDESQQALGEKALCADLRPHTARSINDRYLRIGDDGIGGETVVPGVGVMSGLSVALIGVQYPPTRNRNF
jgi:hypothetical protein